MRAAFFLLSKPDWWPWNLKLPLVIWTRPPQQAIVHLTPTSAEYSHYKQWMKTNILPLHSVSSRVADVKLGTVLCLNGKCRAVNRLMICIAFKIEWAKTNMWLKYTRKLQIWPEYYSFRKFKNVFSYHSQGLRRILDWTYGECWPQWDWAQRQYLDLLIYSRVTQI